MTRPTRSGRKPPASAIRSPRPPPSGPAPQGNSAIPVLSGSGGGSDGSLHRGLFLLFLLLLPGFLGCERPPEADLAAARAATQRARREGATQYAPDELKQAEEALRRAERAVVLESARIAPRRDYRGSSSQIEQTRFLAVMALRTAQARRQRAEEEAENVIGDLRDALDRVQGIRRLLAPRDPVVGKLVVGAGLDLRVAETRAAEENFLRAVESARSGTGRVREAERLLLAGLIRFTVHPELPVWRRWVDEVVKWSRTRDETALVVDKLRRRMSVYRSGRRSATYRVDLGLGGMQRKIRAGDDATPEGLYKIEEVRKPGQTRYHRAFLLDYPNEQDRKRFEQARRRGEFPRGADPGGLIEIHGEGGRDVDWTRGCVALNNRQMDELARIVRVGTRVAIVGYNPRDSEDFW